MIILESKIFKLFVFKHLCEPFCNNSYFSFSCLSTLISVCRLLI